MSTDFTVNSHFDDPKELLDKCEDFDTIMLLLQDAQEKPLSEEDFKGHHFITVKQLSEGSIREQHQQQVERTEKNAHNYLQQEAFQMLREVGPPWTWLYHFTNTAANAASYNFIDQESIIIDATPENTSVESFDFTKALPEIDKDQNSTSTEIAVEKNSLESLRSLIENATNKKKCMLENTSSVISYLKSEEVGVLQRSAEAFKSPLNIDEIVRVLEEADSSGIRFTDMGQLIRHIQVSLLGNVADFPTIISTRGDSSDDISLPYRSDDSISIPHEWEDKIAKQIVAPPRVVEVKKPQLSMTDPKPPASTDTTKIFENTVGMPPEPAAKTQKFCYDSKDEDELVLGLVPLSKPSELVEEEEDIGSALLESDTHSGEGYQQDDFEFHAKEVEGSEKLSQAKVSPDDMRHYCCVNGSTQKPTLFVPPPLQFHCTINPYHGIGAPVSQKTIDDFLGFLRVRARSQRGLIHPRNFKEERCPYMLDSTPMH